jgi:SAM-dependent methyltransferase
MLRQDVTARDNQFELQIEACLREHPQVTDAAVVIRADVQGCTRVVAYVSADLPTLQIAQVARWKRLYELTYEADNVGPSFVGWNSSYNGKPIPEYQMREWLTATIDRIRSLNPTNVLEIGCGTGLLVQQLAPACESYVATDFSTVAIRNLRRWIDTQPSLRHVRLDERCALDIAPPEGAPYDTIILNSVVQYFPDILYLRSVLECAARQAAPGGHIFVGDVRHLGLWKTFHYSVQLRRAADVVTAEELKHRIAEAMEGEAELLVHPQFFERITEEIPHIGTALALPKRGRCDNELTRYRYDVILEIADFPASARPRSGYARCPSEPVLGFHGVHNQRVHLDLAAARLIETAENSRTARELREEVSLIERGGEHPEHLAQLGEQLGYEVHLRCTPGCDDGRFDIEWRAPSRSTVKIGPLSDPSTMQPRLGPSANSPSTSLKRRLSAELRAYMKSRLHGQKLPEIIVILDRLPLAEDGTVDRAALPVDRILHSEVFK